MWQEAASTSFMKMAHGVVSTSAVVKERIMKTGYTAHATYRYYDDNGSIQYKTIAQDVTDEVNEGADMEELADRIYWKEIHGTKGFLDIVGGGVDENGPELDRVLHQYD
jgi:hypothetical protein